MLLAMTVVVGSRLQVFYKQHRRERNTKPSRRIYFFPAVWYNNCKSSYYTQFIAIFLSAMFNDKLMEDVLRDPMTGLFNQRTFVTQLDEALASGEPVCLAMIDVDDFKAVNDTYGHDCGNHVLIFLADTMAKHCTQHDTPYRYGGEEFAILFQSKSIEDAQRILQAILQEFREHKYDFTDAPITFSAGIAQHAEGLTSDTLFEQADQTLYQAKKAGKNRILKASNTGTII